MASPPTRCGIFEYVAEPTDGVSLTTGKAWWGVYVKWRAIGSRKWMRFHLADVHSWDNEAIERALEYVVNRDSRGAGVPRG